MNFNSPLNSLNDNLYPIAFGLSVLWILVTAAKKMGMSPIVQRNTIGSWLLIFIGLSLSKHFFNNLYYAIPFIIVIFILHELLWYFGHVAIFKDEGETTENFYEWANIYCNEIINKELTVDRANTETETDSSEKSSDLSEGLFDNNWNMTNIQAYNNKFDTYFKYLKLEPGMKLLDIGCGNGHWLQYCKNRGVDGMGVTISKSQVDLCIKHGLNVIQGDINKGILKKINGKFDAVSAIGPVEHFSSVSSDEIECNKILQTYYNDVMSLIDTNSKSRRYLNSYMTTNTEYSKYRTPGWYYHIYLICSVFGYGFYNSDEGMMKIYSTRNSQKGIESSVIEKRDYTEDYRWMMGRNKNSIGYCNYKVRTNQQVLHFIEDVLTDSGWWARFLYSASDSWLWQFGGTSQVPIPEVTDTPIRSYIYVTEINKI
jgi:2-polyprenyl-3-methyl-5-hydroxy-6-metoxy-1,4-benzoquinol methylase